jgi:hypothetical protein
VPRDGPDRETGHRAPATGQIAKPATVPGRRAQIANNGDSLHDMGGERQSSRRAPPWTTSAAHQTVDAVRSYRERA